MKSFIGMILFSLIFLRCSFEQTSNHNRQLTMQDCYPFKIYDTELFVISAEIEGIELFDKYGSFFEEHNYSGNGYTWEGHIVQILEKEDPELLNHIDFDPEAGGFFAYADSEENRNKFINVLAPIFKDLEKLEQFVASANRNRIDD